MRVLICGSRHWNDEETIEEYIRTLPSHSIIIHGNCRGADRIAARLGKIQGHKVIPMSAEWNKYGDSAGPIRNKRMLEDGEPDVVVAFHDNISMSKGTKNMIEETRKRGIPHKIIHSKKGG